MQKLEAIEQQVLASPDKQISLTDPDSRSMATSGRGSGVVGYNVQIAVDTEHHLIVHHEVTNVGSDRSQLASTATAAKEVLGVEALEAVADRGYFNGEEIKACDDAGITVTLPKPMTSGAKSAGRFGKQDFVVCLADENVYRCPAGEKLKHYYTNEEKGQKLHRFWTNACRTCALKQRRITVGAQGGARGRADDARQESRCDAHATGDGRASLRNHKDARRTFCARRCRRDEGRHRDGALCADL
jgi:transposase